MAWPTVAVDTTGMDNDTDGLPRAAILDLTTKFNDLIAMRGVAGGVCDLDGDTLVPAARIPASIARLADPTFTGIPAAPTASAGTNTTQLATTAFVQAAVLASFPAGFVCAFAASAAPTGWLKANGALVSRATYAALFAAIGTTFGAGDGSTTFALPDLRGEFVRGYDDGRGVDSGRVFGSAQAAELESHSHNALYVGDVAVNTNPGLPTIKNTGASGAGYPAVAAAGGAETRPRNIALLACIKY